MADEGTGGAATVAEPTSEKLTALKAEHSTAWAKMTAAPQGSKEAIDAFQETYRIGKLIDGEIAEIRKTEANARIAELRNARVKMAEDWKEAIINVVNVHARKGVTLDEKQAASDNEAKLGEVVKNELLAKYAHSTVARVVDSTKTATGTKGEKGAAIVEAYKAGKLEGKTDADIKKGLVAAGHAVGTVGAVILAYQREIGEKA